MKGEYVCMRINISNSDLVKGFEYIQERLDEDIDVDLSKKSVVIFGYNGIGKSSLYNYLKSTDNKNKRDYIEYEDSQINFIKNKDVLKISPYILEIQDKKSKLNDVSKNIDMRKIMKSNFDIGNMPDARPYGDRVVEARRSNTFEGFKSFAKDIDEIIDQLHFISPKDFIDLKPKFEAVEDIKEELNNAILENTKKLLNDALPVIKENDNNTCPLCSTIHDNLEAIIVENLKKLESVKAKVYFDLEKRGYKLKEMEFTSVLEQVNRLKEDNELLQDYILCGGSKETRKNLNKNQKITDDLISEIDNLQEKSEKMYLNLLENKDKIIEDFHKYFFVDKDKVTFNDEEHVIEIKLPRDSKNYSTGEKNLMFFLFQLYSFLGSEKKVLVIDDPVSSLDIINHYKIAYEIIKVASDRDKKVLMMTHSVELLNTLNSQHNRCFDYYYLEEDGKIKLQKIDIRSPNNLITLPFIVDNVPSDTIDLLIVKENADYNDPIHKVFHYDINQEYDSEGKLSNHDLVKRIENYSILIDTGCFLENSKNKVEVVASIRVWLEKMLYDLINNQQYKNEFLNKHTLMARINYLLPRNGQYKITLPKGLTRDYILSKKVFLNQGIHYQSQVMPFAYAINMSIKELNDQVHELKAHFNSA